MLNNRDKKRVKKIVKLLDKRIAKKKKKKLKTFEVEWLERHCVNVQAKTKAEACAIVLSGDFDTAGEAAEFHGEADAYEIKLK